MPFSLTRAPMQEDSRPYTDAEVPGVIRRLVNDREFLQFVARWQAAGLYRFFPGAIIRVMRYFLARELGSVTSIREFQHVVEHYVTRLINASIDSFDALGFESLDPDKPVLFMSNHRDIAGDSMLLNYALYHRGFDTVRIAVGDNLVQKRFATDLMKLNKSFFIRRTPGGRREVYQALMAISSYIRTSMTEEGQSVWIAQSEGRAKNGLDVTDPAVIKMLTLMDDRKNFPAAIRRLNIVPMTLSYEFDPCDAMKARELAALDAGSGYEKAEGEDLLSLATGLTGHKGRVVLKLGARLDDEFDSAEAAALEVTRQIARNLTLFPVNCWAAAELGEARFNQALSQLPVPAVEQADVRRFEARFADSSPVERRHRLLMYANPVLNKAMEGDLSRLVDPAA